MLIFAVGRHGEGYHNLAEAFYGTKAWDVRLLLSLHSHISSVTGPSKTATEPLPGPMLS
jgi:hypothetical protein